MLIINYRREERTIFLTENLCFNLNENECAQWWWWRMVVSGDEGEVVYKLLCSSTSQHTTLRNRTECDVRSKITNNIHTRTYTIFANTFKCRQNEHKIQATRQHMTYSSRRHNTNTQWGWVWLQCNVLYLRQVLLLTLSIYYYYLLLSYYELKELCVVWYVWDESVCVCAQKSLKH